MITVINTCEQET